jgi:hypothetical protein
MYAERTSGRTAHPMKERAIVIFEKEEEKKKGRGLERTDGRDGERWGYAFPFSISDNMGHALIIICNKNQRKKGINHWYHLLVCTTDGTSETRYQM